jgi:glutaryl-CoA dehydrogenase
VLVQLGLLQDAGVFRDEHSALAKAYVTSRMREVVAWCREIFGGNGIESVSERGCQACRSI